MKYFRNNNYYYIKIWVESSQITKVKQVIARTAVSEISVKNYPINYAMSRQLSYNEVKIALTQWNSEVRQRNCAAQRCVTDLQL